MTKQPHVSDTASTEAPTWVAPRQSIEAFSVAEFTQNFADAGDDGSGVFTAS